MSNAFDYLNVATGDDAWLAIQRDGFTEACKALGLEGSQLWNLLQNKGPEEFRLETERAMLHLDTWGSTSSTSEPWEGYFWCEQSYAPEWLSHELNDDNPEGRPEVTHDDCVTVLCPSYSSPHEVEGWRIAYSYEAGEHECPWCGDSFRDEDHSPKREECKLCEGDGAVYDSGTTVVIYAPLKRPKHYISGSGEPGCLYDNGPNVSDTKEAAIEDLCFLFQDCVGKGTLARMRRDLEQDGIHYFDRRIRPFAGASYCEISECDCEGYDHPEGEDE